jgi:plastocyanin
MATPIRIKRSAVPGKRPTTDQLQLGELAVNFYDGKIFFNQQQNNTAIGTRLVEIGAGSVSTPGKTLFVTSEGNDLNSGLNEVNAKATIKSAVAAAIPGDTVKVFPGTYLEENPIYIPDNVSIEGLELRRCLVQPKNPELDLFYIAQGVHLTDLSFVGQPSQDGAAVMSYRPLAGVSDDRFFDAARLIRQNIDFIAEETLGYIESIDYQNPPIDVDDVVYRTSIKNAMLAACHDITRGGNTKCIDNGKTYFNGNSLNTGIGVTHIDALNYSVGIARSCINNHLWTGGYQTDYRQVRDLSIQADSATGSNHDFGSCANVHSAITVCVGIVTGIIQNGINGNPATTGFTTTYPGNGGDGFDTIDLVTSAGYDNLSGVVTFTVANSNYKVGDRVEFRDLLFSCHSGSGINTTTQKFPSGAYGYEFPIERIDSNGVISIRVGVSTLEHTYESGGFIVDRSLDITNAVYTESTGIVTVTSPGVKVKVGDTVELRNLEFNCGSSFTFTTHSGDGSDYEISGTDRTTTHSNVDDPGITVWAGDTITFDNSALGGAHPMYIRVEDDGASVSNPAATGEGTNTVTWTPSTPGTYYYQCSVSGHQSMIGTITVLPYSGSSAGVTTTFFPDGTNGYTFKVTDVSGDDVTMNVGISTIAHTYVNGGKIYPPYGAGVGIITKGPYVRNCTNFIPRSIGAKIDGFNAEEGDVLTNIGVQGSFNVDSYTQYNQSGIGMSITNGAYAQLVSLFTICDDIAVYTGGGGQCDLTNSNSSFGTRGLVSQGLGDQTSKIVDRYTADIFAPSEPLQDRIVVSGVGDNRPYQGQALFFGRKYYEIDTIVITNPGSGYSEPPAVVIDSPTGPGIAVDATAAATVANGQVSLIDIISSGTQYIIEDNPQIIIDPPDQVGGVQATAEVTLRPSYYTVQAATAPVAGISTVTLNNALNNAVGVGTTVFFARQSFQIVSSHSFQYIGAGNTIESAYPSKGGVTIQENEVVKLDGGQVVYTSTDQDGNFRIGDGVVIDQAAGSVTGDVYVKSLFSQVTPFILALGGD